jgi:hypothetical protein
MSVGAFPFLLVLVAGLMQRCLCNTTAVVLCIPVMGFGYNDDSQDFVNRLLRSIDFCVDHFVIVSPQRAGDRARELAKTYSSKQLHIEVKLLPWKYVGVAETWNLIIQSHKEAPWYLICAYDVKFLPGQLELFSLRFWKRSGHQTPNSVVTANFAHTRWLNMPGNIIIHYYLVVISH